MDREQEVIDAGRNAVEAAALRAQVARLEAALEFYADESNYPEMWLRNRNRMNDMVAPIARDCGERARATGGE